MKKLFILLSLTAITAWGSSAIQAPVVGSSLLNLTGINELTGYNPDFELGTTQYWTASSGDTLAVETGSSVLFGTTSGAYTASASGKFLVSQSAPVPLGLQGGACYLGLYYKYSGNTGDYSVSVDNATDILASAVSLPKATTPRYVEINYPCGSTNNRLKITSNVASPSTIYIDNAYMGSPKNVGTSAQAVLVGGVTVTGCSSYWSTASTSLASFGTQTSCSFSTFGLAQNLQAGPNYLPKFSFASLPPGDYMIQYEGQVGVTGGATAGFQFTDGTNTARELSIVSASGQSYVSGIKQTITYTTAQSNVTFELKGKTSNASFVALVLGQTSNQGVFTLWYFPSSAQQAVKIDQVPASWSGYHNGWTGNSTTCHSGASTYADVSACTGITLNQLTNRNFGTVTTAAGSLPGIVITPSKTGMYQICASGSLYNSTSLTASVRMVDGSGTIINPGASVYLAAYSAMPSICGIYNATAATATTIKLQLAASPGSAAFWVGQATGSGLNWTVTALDQGMAAPMLQGNVTSNTAGQEKIERAIIVNSSAGQSITSQSGSWILANGCTGTGLCNYTMSTNTFSGTPSCTCSGDVGTSIICTSWASSSTSLQIRTRSSAADVNSSASIICMGPKN